MNALSSRLIKKDQEEEKYFLVYGAKLPAISDLNHSCCPHPLFLGFFRHYLYE